MKKIVYIWNPNYPNCKFETIKNAKMLLDLVEKKIFLELFLSRWLIYQNDKVLKSETLMITLIPL